MAGLVLDPWQEFVLDGALGERPDGKWSAFEVGLLVPRQNGKGGILEARELAGLFLFGERLILHSAHEFKTAQEAFLRILSLIQNTPDLDRRVNRVRTSHGEEGIELKGGQRLRFIARSRASGRGFSGDCIVLDEAMMLGTDAIGALMPTMSARPNPQLWYTSSAGNEDSTQLARVVKRGRDGHSKSLAYFEWCAAKKLPKGDEQAKAWASEPENWIKANPAIGIRISLEYVSKEFEAMDLEEFARERLGIGTYPEEGERSWEVISEDAWSSAADTASQLVDPVAFGIDVSPESVATIAVAGARSDGFRHVEVVAHQPGTTWVVNAALKLQANFSSKAFAIDPRSPAGSLITDLENAGVVLHKVNTGELGQACGAFYNGVEEYPQRVRHLGQPELTSAVKGAHKRVIGDAWAWARRDLSVDISPLMAATLALRAFEVVQEPEEEEAEVWFMN